MIINTVSAAVTGLDHIKENKECQDAVNAGAADGKTVIAVADGRTGAQFGTEGARISVTTVNEVMTSDEMWREASKGPKPLKNHFLSNFRTVFNPQKSSSLLSDYDATCAAAGLNENGSYVLFSIGDCLIIRFNQELEPSIAMWPTKFGNTTFFTEMCADINRVEEVNCSMQVWKGNLEKEKLAGFAVVTDGADYFMSCLPDGYHRLRDAAARCVLADGSNTNDLHAKLEKELKYIAYESQFGKSKKDDAAAAIMLSVTEETKAAAEKIISGAATIDCSAVQQPTERSAFVPLQPDSIPKQEIFTLDGRELLQPYQCILNALKYNGKMTISDLEQNNLILRCRLIESMAFLLRRHLVKYDEDGFSLDNPVES